LSYLRLFEKSQAASALSRPGAGCGTGVPPHRLLRHPFSHRRAECTQTAPIGLGAADIQKNLRTKGRGVGELAFAPNAAVELDALADSNKIGIVFGREDRGLTNSELKLCHRLVTIPTAPEYPSLNLAQAVMVVAYELMMATTTAVLAAGAPKFVAASISDPMLERLAEALVSIGFIPDDNPEHIMLAIREIFGRSGLTAREVEILNGMARQMRWVADGGHRTIAEKRRAGTKLR